MFYLLLYVERRSPDSTYFSTPLTGFYTLLRLLFYYIPNYINDKTITKYFESVLKKNQCSIDLNLLILFNTYVY